MAGLCMAVIGAGSTYTPELVDGLIRRAAQAHRAEVIAGAELFPAMAELMADGLVHPGNLGHRLYATRLAARLQALGLA